MTQDSLPKPETDTTRQRILEAAEEVFGEKGFKQATVRDILRQAGVGNAAAINYYFRDKDQLYIEAVKYAHQSCSAGLPFPEWAAGTPPERKLKEFIGVMVQRMLQPPRPSALRLMMRELADPTQACAAVVKEYVQPMAQVLAGILSEQFPTMPRDRVFMIGFSIVGQCLFYRQNRPIVEQLLGREAMERVTVDALADHIAGFTLTALGMGTAAPPRAAGGAS